MRTEKVKQHLIGLSYRDIVNNLQVEQDQGDCCGWSDCEITDQPEEGINLDNLILKDCVEIAYSTDNSARVVLNFVFSDGNDGEVILGYELSAGSGSGYSYGAYVSLRFNDEELAEASW